MNKLNVFIKRRFEAINPLEQACVHNAFLAAEGLADDFYYYGAGHKLKKRVEFTC